MSAYQPPYTITPEILKRVAAISEAIVRFAVLPDQARALRLRRINRICTEVLLVPWTFAEIILARAALPG